MPSSILSFRLGEIANLKNQHIHCNTRATYIQATEDKLVPEKCAEEFREVMENLNVFEVSGPHFILQANPSACAEIITNEIRLITSQ